MSDIKSLDLFFPKDINPVKPQTSSSPLNTSKQEGASFSDILKNALNGVNTAQNEADTAVQQALNGDQADVHETMIALQKADTSLKMMLEVRNKLLEAYQEVIKTQM